MANYKTLQERILESHEAKKQESKNIEWLKEMLAAKGIHASVNKRSSKITNKWVFDIELDHEITIEGDTNSFFMFDSIEEALETFRGL